MHFWNSSSLQGKKKQQGAVNINFKYPHWHIPRKNISLQLALIMIYNIEENNKYNNAQIKTESDYLNSISLNKFTPEVKIYPILII